jgi:hypothetical protein
MAASSSKYRARAHADGLRGRVNPTALCQLLADGLLDLFGHPRSPKALPLRPGPPQPRPNSVDDHGVFKLREDAEHLEGRFPRWCARIDSLLMKVQIDSLGFQLGEKV